MSDYLTLHVYFLKFKSLPKQRYFKYFKQESPSEVSLNENINWTSPERTGHPHLYAEAKKTNSPTLQAITASQRTMSRGQFLSSSRGYTTFQLHICDIFGFVSHSKALLHAQKQAHMCTCF